MRSNAEGRVRAQPGYEAVLRGLYISSHLGALGNQNQHDQVDKKQRTGDADESSEDEEHTHQRGICLLYTSDAADDN